MKKLLVPPPCLLLVLSAAAFAPAAGAVEYGAVDAGRSALAFEVREMGVAVDGRFRKFAIDLHFDPAHPDAAKAVIDVDLASIDAGSDEANDEVGGKSWFDTKRFPQARFVSSAVRPLGGNRYEVSGQLSIKGRTRDVSAPVTVAVQGAAASFDGAFLLKRADFSIGEGSWSDFDTVANEIQVKFHIQAAAGR